MVTSSAASVYIGETNQCSTTAGITGLPDICNRLLSVRKACSMSCGISSTSAGCPLPKMVEPLMPRNDLNISPSGLITACTSPSNQSTTVPTRQLPYYTITTSCGAFESG